MIPFVYKKDHSDGSPDILEVFQTRNTLLASCKCPGSNHTGPGLGWRWGLAEEGLVGT